VFFNAYEKARSNADIATRNYKPATFNRAGFLFILYTVTLSMKIVYGISGFAAGIMAGLLLGVLETKLLIRLHREAIVPFVIGFTVLVCVIAGSVIAVKLAAKRMR
jgi:hypothetical protein